MNLKAVFLAFMTFCSSAGVLGQAQPQHRILILLNSSSSMRGSWATNESKYDVATRLLTSLVDSLYLINDEVEFGLRVFGHQNAVKENNCFDTKNEVMFSKDTRTQIFLRLKALRQSGLPSLGYALKETIRDISGTGSYKYSLLVVTDDSLSCEQALCEIVSKNSSYKNLWSVYVLNIGGNAGFESKYNCLGRFLGIRNESNISHSIEEIVSAYRKNIPHKTKHIGGLPDKPNVEKSSDAVPTVKDTVSFAYSPIALDTPSMVKPQSAIVIKKGSRIKTDSVDKFGHLNLINEVGVNTVRIQSIDKWNEGGDLKFVQPGKTKLKAGHYSAFYSVNGREVSVPFKILADMITDVRLK